VASGDGADLEALQTGAGSRTQTSPDERAQVASCLTPVLGRLAASDREAIVLTELEGLRVAEAAARAGVSISGMKSRARRARGRLRSAILACCDVALDARGAPIGCAQRDKAGAPCPLEPAP
jgi:RNA polymerase sigma-70 factor (ECF subfamily)